MTAPVVFLAIACGTSSPEPRSADSGKTKPAHANTGELTVHVKDMAKRLKLT
jgi:hypothetical protein